MEDLKRIDELDEESIENLLKDQKLFADLLQCDKDEEFIALFREKGISVTSSDVKSILASVKEQEKKYSKMSDKELENIFGGVQTVTTTTTTTITNQPSIVRNRDISSNNSRTATPGEQILFGGIFTAIGALLVIDGLKKVKTRGKLFS